MAHLLSRMFSCRTGARTSAVHTVSWVVTGETIDTNDNIYCTLNYNTHETIFNNKRYQQWTKCISMQVKCSLFYY